MKKHVSLFLFVIMFVTLFVSCEKEKEREFGIDGYAYLAEQISIQGMENLAFSCQEANGKLYFVKDGSLYNVSVGELPDFQKAYKVGLTDTEDQIRKYGVDEEENIYWDPVLQLKERYLNKYIARTGENVKIPLVLEDEVINAIVTAPGGRVCLLLDNAIWALDQDGNLISIFYADEYRWQDDGIVTMENLMADSAGNLFYLQRIVLDTRVRVLYEGTKKWVELSGLPEMFSVDDLFLTGEGKIFVNADDALYEYDLESAQSTPVLRFHESNLDRNSIRDIIYLDEDRFIAIGYSLQTQSEMYLLTRTPVEELPHKQTIVLASLFPSSDLEKAVVEFNRMSEDYTVVIDRYGAGTLVENERTQAARTRLESSLVSSDPPDLLDMNMLNIATYAEKNALADLYPYLEESDLLDIEDYLENVVEGYTINGRLVCLPISFYLNAVIGRTSQVGSGLGWTFEDLNAVLEKYPDMKLFHRNYMLYYFLYDYYVNTFIDFETGECNFDSDEFREFVQWIDKYALTDVWPFTYDYVPADVLVDQDSLMGFTEFSYQRTRFGEDITLIGLVTKDGTPSYRYQPNGEVGIVDRSKYKDGAWAFLEYFIFSKGNQHQNIVGSGFPTNRDALMEMAEAAMEVRQIKLADGEVIIDDVVGTRSLNNELVEIRAATQEEVDIMMETIENIDFSQVSSLDGIVNILLEELEPYYNGEKSLEEVTRIINSRVQLMVSERMSSR